MHEIVWQFSLISAFLNIKVNLLLFPSSLVLTVYKRAILLSVLSTLSTTWKNMNFLSVTPDIRSHFCNIFITEKLPNLS